MCGVKETQCSHCDHLQVCSLKEEFLAAQKKIDDVCVSLGDNKMKYLRDFDWIKSVALECIHFSKKKPTRREDAEANCVRSAVYEAPGI